MNKLIDLFIKKTVWVNGFTVVVTLVGLISLFYMKRDLHPAFKFNYVMVYMTYPNASAEEVEKTMTYPIEEKLRDVSDLEEITSTSNAGRMSITLKFPQSVKNINDKIEETRALVQSELRLLPPEIRDFNIQQASDSKIFLAQIGVSGLDESNFNHHEFIDSTVRKLKSIEGISGVESSLRPFHIFIKFDKEVLNKKQVTVAQIRSAVRNELASDAISSNSLSGKNWLLEYANTPTDLNRIRNLQIRNNGAGNKLTLGDVAEVKYQQLQNNSKYFLLNGKNAIDLTILKNEKFDSIKTFELVEKTLASSVKPQGVEFSTLYSAPYFINQQISVLLSNGVGGLLLVLLVLGFAMGWKTSLMTAIGLPISYFGTFFILKMLGISIDLISLIAMILVVGNLVDDAVIYAERYNQLLFEGLSPEQAAGDAAKELIVPVTGTILTIICAFVPMLIIDSELSVVFFAIPVVVAVSLSLSWFETFFILPNHMQHYVRKPAAEKASVFFYTLASKYKVILKHTLKFRYLYAAAAIALLVTSLLAATKMPQNFNLSISPPSVELAIILKEEHEFNKIIEILKPLHEQILLLPKNQLDYVSTSLGSFWQNGKNYRGAKYAKIRLVLDKTQADTKTLRESVEAEINLILKGYKPIEIAEIKVTSGQRDAGERKTDLATLKIEGKNQEQFNLAKNDILETIKTQKPNLEYVAAENNEPDNFKFTVNQKKIDELGISKNQLALQIKSLTGPSEILETRTAGKWVNIYLEPITYEFPSVKLLNQLQVQGFDDGQKFGLGQLGEWQQSAYNESIDHKNGNRNLKLDFKYDGKSTNETVVKNELKALLSTTLKKYPALNIEVVDANEQDKAGRDWGLKIVLLSGIAIYLILAVTLGSFLQPFIVGLPIPFAVMGVIWALKLHNMQLGLMVMLGIIGTMGVAVNDSIVMVHQVNLLWKKYGIESAELLIEAASSRLRAIVLTASCTLIGVFPTAYGIGGESGFTQPLAFAMGWGLASSLLLTLFIIPAMLMVLKDVRYLFSRINFKKNKPIQIKDSPQIDLPN